MTPSLCLIFHATKYAICICILQVFLIISEVRQTIDERFLDQNRYLVLSLDNCERFTLPAYSPASVWRIKLVHDTTCNNFTFAGFFFSCILNISAQPHYKWSRWTLNHQFFHTCDKTLTRLSFEGNRELLDRCISFLHCLNYLIGKKFHAQRICAHAMS